MNVGLCASCQHVRKVTSKRGSTFYQCGLARTDSSYRKYPPLPVRECTGYRPAPGSSGGGPLGAP